MDKQFGDVNGWIGMALDVANRFVAVTLSKQPGMLIL